jgi:outer membrane receptor for ferrienterochelin and colicin
MKTLSIKKIILFIVLYALSIYGQGILKGTVTDSLTAEPLKGAEVILTGTTFNDVSDINGEFIITGIPNGDYILQASYLGYKEKKILITIKSEETQILNIELQPNITNETDLSSQLKSQAEEINMQLNSNIIKNVIPGKKLQDMPDGNISEALSRLPGVSVIYRSLSPFYISSGSASNTGDAYLDIRFPPGNYFPIVDDPAPTVLIRGLDSKFANVTIDGIRIPSTSANDKSIDLSIFPEREFKNIDLNKTITSDEDADATAGAVNIVTGKAPNKRMIKAELLGNYNELDKSGNQYNFTGSFGERFFGNLLGVQANVNAGKKILSNEYQKNSPLPGPFPSSLSYTNAIRKGYGANILLDFNTPDGGSIKFNNILTKTSTEYFSNEADSVFSPIASANFSSDHTFYDRKTDQRIFLSSIGGSNYLLGFKVDWNTAFSESKTDHPLYFTLNFSNLISYPVRKDYLANTIDNPSKNYDKEKTVSINFSRNYKIGGGIMGGLKFGGKYRINSRYYDEYLRAQDGNLAGNNQYIQSADGSLVKKDFSGTRFGGLLGKSVGDIFLSYFQDDPPGERTVFDNYKISLINMDALRLWRQLNYGSYYYGADINSYNYSENVSAGYIMHYLDFGQSVKFITGLRIESEQNDFGGYYFPKVIATPAGLYNGTPQQTNVYHYNKTTLLPNFQMVLKPADFLNLRLAAYKTLIRPDYNARMPKYFSVSYYGHNYLNMGNPGLKNADVWNYELQTQFYGNVIGMFSINAFYKNIKGMQKATNGIPLSSPKQIDSLGINLSSFPIKYPFGSNSQYNFYSYYNSPKPTRIWGFEIEHQANFRYLPGLFKNIILNYNLTFLRSATWTMESTPVYKETTEFLLSDHEEKLSDMPEFFANVILGYDIKSFSFRISYFYQDGYPVLDNSYFGYEVEENKFSRLDIAARQKILGNISIYLSLNNITNSKEEFSSKLPYYQVIYKSIIQAYRYGMNVDFGAGIKL